MKRPVFSLRLFAAVVLLSAPYCVMGAWAITAQRPRSVVAFVVSLALMMMLLAGITRTWRRFLLAQFPVFILSAGYTEYTIIYNNPPGNFLALILATSSWQETLGLLTIRQGQMFLLPILGVAVAYLAIAWRLPGTPIMSRQGGIVRWATLALLVPMSLYASQSADDLMDGIAVNPAIGSLMFLAGPLPRARAQVHGSSIVKVPYGAKRAGAEEIHILVIGESARRDSWSVYRRGRKTTPYLETLVGQAIFLQHAVADANLTMYAVPMMLTGMEPGEFKIGAVRGNLVDLAKEAGYSTSWLENNDMEVTASIGMSADRLVRPPDFTGTIDGRRVLDDSLLPALRSEFTSNGKSRFIGVHIMASHWPYYSRYPASFQRFGSTAGLNLLSIFTPGHDQQLVDSYDNTVLYTDWLLQQIIEEAKKSKVPVTVTFFADHGEDLSPLDGSSGHGGPTYTAHQFDVPAFVWANDAYRTMHPDKVLAITRNAGKEIRTHNVFFTEADLMGVVWPGENPALSFASARFVPYAKHQFLAGGVLLSHVINPSSQSGVRNQ